MLVPTLCLLAVVLVAPTLVLGQEVEPNDTCLTAQFMGAPALPFTLGGSLDPIPPAFGEVDFFVFGGAPNAAVTVDLEGQSTGKGTLGDPLLGFFNSGCGLIALDDDGGDGSNSRLHITIPADGFFVLGVTRCCDGAFIDGGVGSYQLSIQGILPPTNDNFSSATPIGALPFSDPVDTAAATEEPGEPTPSCSTFWDPGHTVWYSFTPSTSGSISTHISNAGLSTSIAAYTGSSLGTLTEIGCRAFGGVLTLHADPGLTQYFQVAGLFGAGGQLQFNLEVAPPPVASFGFFPFDPSAFDDVQFFDTSFDPGNVGIESRTWDFGDGTTSTAPNCCPIHRYGADGDYMVQLTVLTFDGRAGSFSRPVSVRTHDVAIAGISAPRSASARQSRTITVDVKNHRYPETVEVQLFRSVPGGFELIAFSRQSVPLRQGNHTTSFNFRYTFTSEDANLEKVTFKAVATIVGSRDALPADNEAISSPPTKVTR